MPIHAILRGDSIDLDILAGLFPAPSDPTVSADADGYYLSSPSLPDTMIDDGNALHAEATKLLRNVNGAARLLSASYRPVELAGTFHDPAGHMTAVVVLETITVRGHVHAVASVAGQPAPPPVAPSYIDQAGKHQDAADVLALLGKPTPLDWSDLYKVYEIVRANVDTWPGLTGKGATAKLLATGWTAKAQISAFTAGANHQGASGSLARHARESGPPPTQAMSMPEGTRFIQDLVSRWLAAL